VFSSYSFPNPESVNESDFRNFWGTFISAKVVIVDPVRSIFLDLIAKTLRLDSFARSEFGNEIVHSRSFSFVVVHVRWIEDSFG